jgi:hypothetical protein
MKNLKTILAAAFLLGLGGVALADLESDFKDAAGRDGCASIPYSSLRSDCGTQQSGVDDWCKNSSRPVSCGSESQTRDIKRKIEDAKRKVEDLKNKKRDLEDKKNRATNDADKNQLGKDIEQVDKDIYDANKLVDAAVAELDVRKKFVEDAIYNINKCIDYRQAVMNIFATAQDKVRGETDPKVTDLARTLRDKYEESKRGHAIAITEKNNALSTCKDSRP